MIIFIFIFVMAFYDDLYSYLLNYNANFAYYFSFLKDPIAVLNTRFGSVDSEGSLSYVFEILKKSALIGVGPASVNGEIVGDNAYVVLIHNGGLIALIITMIYYRYFFIKGIKFKNNTTILIILMIFILSMGMPILIGANISLFILYYLLIEFSLINKQSVEIK